MAEIIIAGGGHGGIAAAAKLSKNGFNTTVYERNEKNKMGYDWTDIFDRRALISAGIGMPSEDKFTVKGDVTFYGPSGKTKFVQYSPKNQPQIKMERSDIYDLLISHAESCGVKFEYNCNINSPIIKDDRVVGIKTDKGDFFGDLIIDACGCDSPLRKNLPDCFGIQKEMKPFEKFNIYRAFYNNETAENPQEEFKLTLLPQGKSGIGWVCSEKDYTDVLIGRFEPFTIEEANQAVEYFRTLNSNIGTDILRGGSFAAIPVRQPLAKMVADGYAAIGDSAFMTIPLIGSGIANALYASNILADTVLSDISKSFTAQTLWNYQKTYFKKIAPMSAPLACLKNVLAKMSADKLDTVFDKDIIEFQEHIPFNDEKIYKLTVKLSEILIRIKNAVSDKDFSKEVLKSVKNMAKLVSLINSVPSEYSEDEVLVWAQKYNRIFD